MRYDITMAALIIGATGCLLMAAMTLTRGREDWDDSCTYARNGKGPEAPGISWWHLAGWCVLGSVLWVGLLGLAALLIW